MNILLLTGSEYLFEYELTALKEITSKNEGVHFKLLTHSACKRSHHFSSLISKIDKRFSNYPVSALKQTHFNNTSFNITLVENMPLPLEIDFALILSRLNEDRAIVEMTKEFSVYTFHYSEKLIFSNSINNYNTNLSVLKSPKGEASYFKVLDLCLNAEKGIYNCRDKYLFYAGLYLGKQISKLTKSYEKIPFAEASVSKKITSLSIWLYYVKLSIQIFQRKLRRTELNWRIALKKENKTFELPQPRNTFWADPFVFLNEDNLFIFFEELVNQKGVISVLKLNSELEYISKETALVEDYHLSFPTIFKFENQIYMLPESSAGNVLNIYKCDYFPTKWSKKITLINDKKIVDAVWIFSDGYYWIFANVINDFEVDNNEQLHLFYSTDLFSSNWISHPCNPIVTSIEKSRNAGLIRNEKGRLIRVSQNCKRTYGGNLVYNEILCLTIEFYEETTTKVEYPPKEFEGMHTFNTIDDITVVDFLKREKIKSS